MSIVNEQIDVKRQISQTWSRGSNDFLNSVIFPSDSLVRWQMKFCSFDQGVISSNQIENSYQCESPGMKRTETNLHLSLVCGARFANILYVIRASHAERVRGNRRSRYLNIPEKETNASGRVQVEYGKPLNLHIPLHELERNESATIQLDMSVFHLAPVVDIPVDSSLVSVLKSTIDSSTHLNDVTLFLGPDKEPIRAQKFMLMARSPVFTAMFQAGMKEQRTNEVVISDFSPAVCKEMLTYIYTEEPPNISSMAEDLWLAAEKYQLPGLKAKCENTILWQLTVENAANTLLFADRYCGPGKLREFVMSFITKDKSTCMQVMKTEAWSEVKKSPSLALEVSERYFDTFESEPSANVKKPRTE